MFEWDKKASNAILLDDNVGGKGKCFRTRFLQPGLVKYSFGVCLLDKEVIDKFVYQFEGCPVIIDHKDVTSESAKNDRVGVISKVWFDQFDGWYWGEGVIFEQEALNLIDKGYNVSCQYEITEYSENRENKLHNGNEYNKVILNGRPEHLAIVKNPRYENAMIAVNALDVTVKNGGEGSGRKTESFDGLLKDKINGVQKVEPKKVEPKAPEKTKEEQLNEKKTESIVYEHSQDSKPLSPSQSNITKTYDKSNNTPSNSTSDLEQKGDFPMEEIKELLNKLLAKNEAKEEKGEEKAEDLKADEPEKVENKCKNEEPDYKKMYEELKAKMEAGNEKAKNAMDNSVEAFYTEASKKESDYISEAKARELGKKLY